MGLATRYIAAPPTPSEQQPELIKKYEYRRSKYMPIQMIDRNGPPSALLCPTFLCDACGTPLHRDGWVVWWSKDHLNNVPINSPLYFTCARRCVTALEKGMAENVFKFSDGWFGPSSLALGEVVSQLAHNFSHPFAEDDEPGIQYVAPSGWSHRTEVRA